MNRAARGRLHESVLSGSVALFWFYVNSWGRAKKEIALNRVGAEAPARFLCIAEEDSFSEIREVTHTKANPL